MPHIKLRGVPKGELVKNSTEIIDALAEIITCDRTWFTLEHIESEYIFDGEITYGCTFAEVFWFERGEVIKTLTAQCLTKILKKINNNNDVTILFFALTGDNYYENGEHFQ